MPFYLIQVELNLCVQSMSNNHTLVLHTHSVYYGIYKHRHQENHVSGGISLRHALKNEQEQNGSSSPYLIVNSHMKTGVSALETNLDSISSAII